MPNIKVNNLAEFKEAWDKLPEYRLQLAKAFPQFATQRVNELFNTLYNKEEPKVEVQPKVETKPQVTPKPVTQANKIEKITGAISKGANALGKVARVAVPGLAIASAVGNWNAEGATPQSRTTDTLASISGLFPGIGTGTSIGLSTLAEAQRNIAKKGAYDDTEYNKWLESGGNFDPTYFNQDTIDRYTQHILNQDITKQVNDLGNAIDSIDSTYWNNAEARLANYIPQAINQIKTIPEPNNKILIQRPLGSSTTLVNNQIPIGQPVEVQAGLMPNVVASNSIEGLNQGIVPISNIPSGAEIRTATNLGLNNLSDITQGYNRMQNAPIPNRDLNEYAQLLGAVQRNNEARQAGLLNEYLNALQQENDRFRQEQYYTNLANQVLTASPRVTAGYVQSSGRYVEPDYVGRNPMERLRLPMPERDTTQSDIARARLELNSNLANQQLDAMDRLQSLESAQALGNQLGVDPAVFMNEEMGKQYLQYILNPQVVGKERRADIYPQTYADILKQRNELAGDVDLANLNNQAQLQRALLNTQAIRDQATISGEYGLIKQLMQDQNANYRARLAQENEAYLKLLGYDNAKDIANIYANQGLNVARFKAQQEQQNPVEAVRAFSALLGNTRTPAEAQMYFNALMGDKPLNVQQGSTGSNLTPAQWQTWLNLTK